MKADEQTVQCNIFTSHLGWSGEIPISKEHI